MRASANKRTVALLALVVAGAALAIARSTDSHAAGQQVTFDLCAKTNPAWTVTGTTTIPIWGFGIPTTAGDCSTAAASLPGPVLPANEGDSVTINLTNALPTGHALRFEIPGISFDPGETDVAVGTTKTISFTASAPGTYLYQSGGDAGRQEAMGLYGALIVRPPTAGQAYDAATTAYDVESTLVLSQVDPGFNAAPETFDLNDYLARYWLINGKAYPDTDGIAAAPGQKVLLRYLNAGYDNTSMAVLGMHEQVLARDAHLLNNPFLAVAETIPAGGTEDAIATMPSFAAPTTKGFPLFNRNLHVTNGSAGIDGGMLTFVHP